MRSRRKPTAFRPAFDSAQEVHDLVDQGLAERVTREQAFEAGLKLHRGVGDTSTAGSWAPSSAGSSGSGYFPKACPTNC